MIGNRMLLPGMIGIALAVGIGVQMGESVIGRINPIHFRGAAPPVQAVDSSMPPPAQSAYAQAYGWEQGNVARAADGGSAADFDYVPQPAAVQRVAEPVWHDPPPSMTPWPPGRVSSHPEVERYTDYPIEAKPASQPESDEPESDEPEPEPDASPLAPTGK